MVLGMIQSFLCHYARKNAPPEERVIVTENLMSTTTLLNKMGLMIHFYHQWLGQHFWKTANLKNAV